MEYSEVTEWGMVVEGDAAHAVSSVGGGEGVPVGTGGVALVVCL